MQCLLRRDSFRRTRLGLKETSTSAEHKRCTVIADSTEALEVKNELQKSPAALQKSCLPSPTFPSTSQPLLTSPWMSNDLPPQRQGAANEPKLPHTLSVWSFPLPFRSAAASICQGHTAAAFCHSLSLETSKTPKPEASHPTSASHPRQPVKEHNLVALPAAPQTRGQHAAVPSVPATHSKPLISGWTFPIVYVLPSELHGWKSPHPH